MTNNQEPDAGSQPPETRDQSPGASNRPFIIPIFLPHAGCPHRCVFCNQSLITGVSSKISSIQVRNSVESFLKYKSAYHDIVQIAFFGGNFLGIDTEEMVRMLAEAAAFVKTGRVNSIRFSTRPDTIDRPRLDLIKNFPVSTVELGVQSMDDRVLVNTKRGHTSADTQKAVQRLKEFNYEIGVQIMVGLPGDGPGQLLASARRVAELKPDFIRIYPTVVVAGSPLAKLHKEGRYAPLSLKDAVAQVKELYRFFSRKNIQVIRMGLQATDDLKEGSTILAGPYHPSFGHLVYSDIFLDRAISAIRSANPKGDAVVLHVHPRSVSKMRGLKNGNIKKLRGKFYLQSIKIVADDSLKEDQLKVNALPY
jgi:histone acetyltransferase (RNA polymerase elongator complex component)